MDGATPTEAAPAPAETQDSTPAENPSLAPEQTTSTQVTGDTSLEAGTQDAPQSDSPAETDPFKAFAEDKKNSSAEPTTPPAENGEAPLEDDSVPTDWKEALPQAMQKDPYLNKFNSIEEFMKGVQNMQQLLGKKGLERPDENAPPEHWNEYWDTIGRPKSPSDYKIENLKDSTGAEIFEFDKETLGEYSKKFHQKGLTNDQAQFVMEEYARLQMTQTESQKAAHQERTDHTLTQLQLEYKEAADSTIRRALNALEGTGIYDLLAEAGLETDYRAIKAGIKLSEEFSESVVGHQASVKDASTRLQQIETSKAFMNKHDPNHDKVIQERNKILAQMHGG